MSIPPDKHLLLPYDNGLVSRNALDYCSLLFKDDPAVVFHLLYCLNQVNQPVIPEPEDYRYSLLPEKPVDSERIDRAEHILARGRDVLRRNEVAVERILCSHSCIGGRVSETIEYEARRLLADCIVVARRDLGYVGEMVLGSIPAALFREVHTTPLWIVDGTVAAKDILVAVDGSVFSLRAVDHLAYMFRARTDVTIYLYHCSVFLAPDVVCRPEAFYPEWERDWCDTHLASGGCLFNGPRQLLREAEIPDERIVVLPETTTLAESTSIISQANKHGCGTIVIGRRGPGVSKGFFGGVPNRTIRHTQDMAVWIVG